MFHNFNSKTMDSAITSSKRFLYTYCITDGILDNMSEEERTALILSITKIKEEMLKGSNTTESIQKYTSKVSK